MNLESLKSQLYDRKNGYTSKYKNAAPFIDSNESKEMKDLWDFCLSVVLDEKKMSCIAFANEFGIPPVKSLLFFYEKDMKPKPDFEFNEQQSQWLGTLMGYVFKFYFGFSGQKERCKVQKFGVRTATKFIDPPEDFVIA
jgi:hypothetical protein